MRRRQVLRLGVAALPVALAGCTSTGGADGGVGSTDTPSPSPTDPPTATPSPSPSPTPTASPTPSATPTLSATPTESDSPTAPGGTPGTATRTGTGTADAFEVVSDATSTPVPETTTADAFRLGAYIALAIVALRTLRVAEREE